MMRSAVRSLKGVRARPADPTNPNPSSDRGLDGNVQLPNDPEFQRDANSRHLGDKRLNINQLQMSNMSPLKVLVAVAQVQTPQTSCKFDPSERKMSDPEKDQSRKRVWRETSGEDESRQLGFRF